MVLGVCRQQRGQDCEGRKGLARVSYRRPGGRDTRGQRPAPGGPARDCMGTPRREGRVSDRHRQSGFDQLTRGGGHTQNISHTGFTLVGWGAPFSDHKGGGPAQRLEILGWVEKRPAG